MIRFILDAKSSIAAFRRVFLLYDLDKITPYSVFFKPVRRFFRGFRLFFFKVVVFCVRKENETRMAGVRRASETRKP
jgi:hypothetical protein